MSKTAVEFEDVSKVHCIGIGGIGVSAIARYFAHEGKAVSGSDASESPVLEGLAEEGIDVTVGHHDSNLDPDTDLVIRSIAVPADNPELVRAQEEDVPTMTYPEALGLISENMFTVAVSGTHGKTTTTAMLAEILEVSDKDPTVIVGSFLKDAKSNFIPGDDDLFVVEACEYKRSFLHLSPDVLVVTNIDTDHLDYFDGMDDVQEAFTTLAEKVPQDGAVVCDPNEESVLPVVENLDSSVIEFSSTQVPDTLSLPGAHNKSNAKAAVTASAQLNVKDEVAKTAVKKFSGTWRRYDNRGKTTSGAIVYDDYGHHPSEIAANIKTLKEEHPDKKLVVIFQPHLYSRTKLLLDEFPESFVPADEVLVLPIYASRETPDPSISSESLVETLTKEGVNARTVEDFQSATDAALQTSNDLSVIVTQGAGDVYKVADELTKEAVATRK